MNLYCLFPDMAWPSPTVMYALSVTGELRLIIMNQVWSLLEKWAQKMLFYSITVIEKMMM